MRKQIKTALFCQEYIYNKNTSDFIVAIFKTITVIATIEYLFEKGFLQNSVFLLFIEYWIIIANQYS